MYHASCAIALSTLKDVPHFPLLRKIYEVFSITSMLDSFYQEDVTDTGARLSVRPTQEMAIIKHDARTGMMSIIVPDKDENDSNARNSEITITKVDFVPFTVVNIEKGKGIGSNATILDTVDFYKFSDNGQSVSIGVVIHDGA